MNNNIVKKMNNTIQNAIKEKKPENMNKKTENQNLINDSVAHWPIIESYFDKEHLQQLVRHQLESYNDFIGRQIPETINMFNPATIVSDHDFDKKSGKYALEISVTFENFGIYRPQIHENNGATKLMFPQEARLRNFTYASSMTVNMNIKYIVRTGEMLENIQTIYKVLPKIHIGKIPIMLRSSVCVLTHYKHMPAEITGECKMDPGGYFIINGSEKTCLGQERAAENSIFCFNITKNNSKWSYIAEIKSIPDWKCISPKQIAIMMSQKSNSYGYGMWVQIPRLKQPIPLVIAFRALGIISDKEICEKIVLDIESPNNKIFLENIKASLVEANTCMTQEAAIKYITSQVIYTPLNMDKETGQAKKREFALDVLNNDLYPHCHNKTQKVYFLGYMTLRLLKCCNCMIATDDRDSYTNKRIDLTGVLLNNLFRNYFNKLVKDMQKQVIREINNGSWRSTEDFGNIINLTNIYKIVKSTTIENGFKRALATGDFGIKQTNSNKVGVAQVLNRLTYVSSLSHLRRCNTPIDKSGKLIPPRKLHNSTWGFLCPAETPEGASVGVVKNIAYLATITIASNTKPIREYLATQIISLDTPENLTKNLLKNLYNYVKVIVNGAWIGVTDDPITLYNSLKLKKYKGIINVYTSIIFNYKTKEILVCNDAGRLIRPVLKVRDNQILITDDIISRIKSGKLEWEDLLSDCKTDESVIEYIDPLEQSWSMIAMNNCELNLYNPNIIRKYTHREIHPSTIFGILASCIPFPEHNQAPRLTYQCAQGKQAMGVYVTNYDTRMDKTAYVHTYGMRPLVDTRLMNLIDLHKIPSGTQVVVAIMTYTGYNQEDSILFNKGAVDRGLFQTTIYHTEKDEDKKIHGDKEIRCRPDPSKTKSMKFGNYHKVNENGVIPENEIVADRDIIISKVLPIKENRNNHSKVIKFEDQSRIYRTKEETYIDKNYIERNGDGYNFAKVRLRTLRQPVIGDKFCVREDSFVLTSVGWVQLKDINIQQHKVATIDSNNCIQYVNPINKFEFDCVDEELYHIQTQQINMVCTKNHKLYVKKQNHLEYEFIEAKDAFGKRLRYKKDAINNNPDINEITLETVKYNMDYYLYLLGSYISTGWIMDENYMTTSNFIELTDNFNNLTPNCLPDIVWSLSQRQSRILMKALLYHKDNMYHTSCLILANEIQRLALHCGWSATIDFDEEAKDILCIRIITYEDDNEVEVNNTILNQVEEFILYTGKVACIEVPETHLFYYKEDLYSPPCWTGNSSRHKRLCRKASCSNNLGSYSRKNSCAPKYIVY